MMATTMGRKIFDKSRVDQILDISQAEAEATCRRLALSGLFCGKVCV